MVHVKMGSRRTGNQTICTNYWVLTSNWTAHPSTHSRRPSSIRYSGRNCQCYSTLLWWPYQQLDFPWSPMWRLSICCWRTASAATCPNRMCCYCFWSDTIMPPDTISQSCCRFCSNGHVFRILVHRWHELLALQKYQPMCIEHIENIRETESERETQKKKYWQHPNRWIEIVCICMWSAHKVQREIWGWWPRVQRNQIDMRSIMWLISVRKNRTWLNESGRQNVLMMRQLQNVIASITSIHRFAAKAEVSTTVVDCVRLHRKRDAY